MSKVVVRVENLGKKFLIGHQKSGDLRQAFREVFTNIVRKDFSSREEFWALKDLNFEVARGEVVGIIGRNGAGKSTLLKVLSRITDPTMGRFEIDGRVSSLLEVGTGFHMELTGRENIFLNGTILGMKKAEIKTKFDEIVAFSGTENFIDTPVKHYSSGMKVRLAFSVAAHLEPEILIIDEVLAVGDAEFQRKCLGKMDEVSRNEGRTILFVSHNMSAVETLCSSAIVLSGGRITFNGEVSEGIQGYVNSAQGRTFAMSWEKKAGHDDAPLEICAGEIELRGQQPLITLLVKTLLRSRRPHKKAFIAYDLGCEDGTPIFQAIPTDEPFIEHRLADQEIATEIVLPALIPGNYRLSIWVGSHYSDTFDWQKEILSFQIETSPMEKRSQPHSKRHGSIVPASFLVHEKIL